MLEAQGLSKSYGGVVALSGADLTVRSGSVHALLGENGAGKSTLVKILAGAVKPDSGEVRLDGEVVSFANTAVAARSGVAVVSQELNLFPELDVLANLYPMREIRRGPMVDRGEMWKKAEPVLRELGLDDVGPRDELGNLSLAERQLVEIARGLITEPQVLILDEPTSALENKSTEALMAILDVLRQREVAVIFVTHILEDVMAHADEVTVLRDGKVVMQGAKRTDLSVREIVAAMLGDKASGVDESGKAPAAIEAVAEAVTGLDEEKDGTVDVVLENVSVDGALDDVDLRVSPGEVVGMAGLAGSGHMGVLELLSGQRRVSGGTAVLPGGRHVPRGLRGAIGSGIALVSGDRKRYGLMLDKPIWENIAQVRSVAMAREGVFVRQGVLRRRAAELAHQLSVRTKSVDNNAGSLSGGNQQKVVFAKWMNSQPSVLLLDDPTRGVDVGAKAEMHRLIRAAADAGAVVILASTDVEELADLCDRVIVFFERRVCAELQGEQLTSHNMLEAMNTGAAPEPGAIPAAT